MHSISAVIITYNEEKNIARCLDSVCRVADEIIVVDAFSTDRTAEIATARGAKVTLQNFSGYVQQKNAANSLASNNYVLSLDADEALDENLIDSIRHAKKNFLACAYYMNRCTNYCGKYIRRGTWYPDRKIRLFDKRVARWNGIDIHEKIELHGSNVQIGHLKGDILHYSFPDIEDHLRKSNKYSSIAANSLYANGKKSSWFKMLINPFWAFFHGYIVRLGFLDGFYGFVISINTAHATFLKYSKLFRLQRSKNKKENVQTLNGIFDKQSKVLESEDHIV